MRAEISYDLVMDDDMPFVEGTYRLPGQEWQVLIVLARGPRDRERLVDEVTPRTWASGMTGLVIRMRSSVKINAASVEQVLSTALGVSEWMRVRGPDSMWLR